MNKIKEEKVTRPSTDEGRETCEEIKEKIQELSGVEDIGIESNKRINSDLKKIYCKLCKQFTKASLSTIGTTLRIKYTHDLVFYNIKKFNELGSQLIWFDIYMKIFNDFKLQEDLQESVKALTKSKINQIEKDHE